MRFLFAFIKDGNNLVKIGMDDGKERWMTTSSAVYGFAKKALKGTDKTTGYGGDEVNVEYTEENGKYNCTRIEKVGGSSTPQQEAPVTTNNAEFKCSECGKALKDGKYTKCYLCNKKSLSKPAQSSADGEYKCIDCGATLKDGKYKKCFTCNQKNPVKNATGTKAYTKSPEESEKIKRLSILSSVCRATSALAGLVDINNIGEIIESLYDRLYKKISG